MSQATQEAIFLKLLIKTIKTLIISEPITIYCDNQASITLAKNPIIPQRSKHIDIKYQFVRDQVQKKTVQIEYEQSENNVSDLFTKLKLRAFIPLIFSTDL